MRVPLCFLWLLLWLAPPAPAQAAPALEADDLRVVHCLLPGQLRQLGRLTTYLAPRRPARLTAYECREKGGEYVLDTTPTAQTTALQAWLPAAQAGDANAQATLGELYERGAGRQPDYQMAALWYQRAAGQHHTAAMIALGTLYERGLGVKQDPAQALFWYQRAAGGERTMRLQSLPSAQSSAGTGLTADIAGPSIILIDPLQSATRGLVRVSAARLQAGAEIIGRITAPAGLLRLTVNGRETTANAAGVFRHRLSASEQHVQITAIDQRGQRADLSLNPGTPDAPQQNLPDLDFGRYHALLIANSRYQYMPDLQTPAQDVAALRTLLEDKYGFTVSVLENSTRYQLLSALNDYRQRLGKQDNLLIYYAGHGELENTNMRGHWLPVDAEPDSTANWISNVSITDMINLMNVRQMLLVADSCYSGTLTRSGISRLESARDDEERETWLRLMLSKRARVVLTSGGMAPVLDAGGGNHSVFARALLEVLSAQSGLLSGQDLYQAVAARVTHAAAGFDFEQVPQYAPIARAGHESGDFFLVPRR